MRSYHFNVGSSSNGPIGFCARVTASSEEEALNLLVDAIFKIDFTLEQSRHFWHDIEPAIEYLNVYFGPEHITVADIDDSEPAIMTEEEQRTLRG